MNIKARNSTSSILYGQLFLVRHLLILKEIASNVDIGESNSDMRISDAGFPGKYFKEIEDLLIVLITMAREIIEHVK